MLTQLYYIQRIYNRQGSQDLSPGSDVLLCDFVTKGVNMINFQWNAQNGKKARKCSAPGDCSTGIRTQGDGVKVRCVTTSQCRRLIYYVVTFIIKNNPRIFLGLLSCQNTSSNISGCLSASVNLVTLVIVML